MSENSGEQKTPGQVRLGIRAGSGGTRPPKNAMTPTWA